MNHPLMKERVLVIQEITYLQMKQPDVGEEPSTHSAKECGQEVTFVAQSWLR